MNRGRLAKYSLWQFRDFVVEKGISIVIIGLLWGYLQLLPFRMSFSPEMTPAVIIRLVTLLAGTLVSIAVLIALNGIISTDRKMGYYRLMFAKPVSPIRYYAQLFLVHLVGLLGAILLLAGLFFFVAGPFSIWNLMLYTTLLYVALGGIGFFVSAATRHDWVTLAAVWVGARVLRALFGNGDDWRSKAVELLPPVHKIDAVAASIIATGAAPLTDVVWLAGYGALFFVLGLVVLRRRSLAT
ncbi:MAG TPA: hypothetical protein VFS56_02130 [Gemmatimonadaceae bacterium]|nr:hypothetical protein [Gemmatimonadaceae bacterium]